MGVGIAIDSARPKKPYGEWLLLAGIALIELAWVAGLFCFVLWCRGKL